jgi:hypothetical protein
MMEWVNAIYELFRDQVIFLILIPVTLVIGTLYLLPFEVILDKYMGWADNYKGSKFIGACFAWFGVVLAVSPLVVYLYFFK